MAVLTISRTFPLYFDMGTEYYSYGIRIYKQSTQGMNSLREKIKESPQKYSEAIKKLYSKGFSVVGTKYKTDHFPEIPDCAAKEILNCKGFFIEKSVPVGENVFSAALADELSEAYTFLSDFFRLIM